MTYEQQLHCPKDGTPMQKQNDRGVIVDQCHACGGTWLDAGELQQIINTVAGMPGFQVRPAGHFSGHRQHRSHHHGSSDGLFGGFFSS